MAKYKIFIDTAADMSMEMAEANGFGVLKFLSIFGEETYVTGTGITNEEFYKKLDESNKIPTTSQTPYGEFYDTLRDASLENDTVIYFTISSKGSGQHNTALMIRDEILENDNPNADIRIFDTMTYSIYITSVALYAKELLDGGMGVDETLEKCREYINSWGVFLLVDTLKYLEKGGRINKASAVVGTLLDIKPVLSVKDGLIESVEKLRGRKKIYKKLVELIRETPDFDSENPEFAIIHSNEEYAKQMIDTLKEEFGIEDVKHYLEFGPIIGTHVGRGGLGVLFRLKH